MKYLGCQHLKLEKTEPSHCKSRDDNSSSGMFGSKRETKFANKSWICLGVGCESSGLTSRSGLVSSAALQPDYG
jgi:hypothetical protein